MRTIALSPLVLLFLSAGVVIAQAALPSPTPAATETGVSVYFSPRGDCQDAAVAQFTKAQTSIDVMAYHLTASPIAKALSDAHKRGVRVRVVLDSDAAGQKYSEATYLSNAGIDTRIDRKHVAMHNKVMIIDGLTVITGSYNFTKAAEERNAENMLVIEGRSKIAAAYLANFEEHLKHSLGYARVKSPEDAPKPD